MPVLLLSLEVPVLVPFCARDDAVGVVVADVLAILVELEEDEDVLDEEEDEDEEVEDVPGSVKIVPNVGMYVCDEFEQQFPL